MKKLVIIILGYLGAQVGLSQETNEVDTSFSSPDRALEYRDLQRRHSSTGVGESPHERFNPADSPEPPLEPVHPEMGALARISTLGRLVTEGIDLVEAIKKDGLDREIGERLESAKRELENAQEQLNATIEYLNSEEGIPSAVCGDCSGSLAARGKSPLGELRG